MGVHKTIGTHFTISLQWPLAHCSPSQSQNKYIHRGARYERTNPNNNTTPSHRYPQTAAPRSPCQVLPKGHHAIQKVITQFRRSLCNSEGVGRGGPAAVQHHSVKDTSMVMVKRCLLGSGGSLPIALLPVKGQQDGGLTQNGVLWRPPITYLPMWVPTYLHFVDPPSYQTTSPPAPSVSWRPVWTPPAPWTRASQVHVQGNNKKRPALGIH